MMSRIKKWGYWLKWCLTIVLLCVYLAACGGGTEPPIEVNQPVEEALGDDGPAGYATPPIEVTQPFEEALEFVEPGGAPSPRFDVVMPERCDSVGGLISYTVDAQGYIPDQLVITGYYEELKYVINLLQLDRDAPETQEEIAILVLKFA